MNNIKEWWRKMKLLLWINEDSLTILTIGLLACALLYATIGIIG